jgi:glycosyltransferase involved in cell wall biosynthesis
MEGFGMSIQEAAACGVPAVASERVPFAVEYLRGEGALLVPPEDVEQTAAALGRLLDDEKLRRQMGERAREITIPRFTWEAAARSFLSEAGIPVPTDAGG